MIEIEVKALVPTARLDQLIGSGDPTSSEIHDMAVELILWRRSVERKAEPNNEAVAALRRAISLIDAMRMNDPNEPVSDAGHVASDIWTDEVDKLDIICKRLEASTPPAAPVTGMDGLLSEQADVNTLRPGDKWRLFPKKTPEEVDRDPVYREVSRQLKPLRDAFALSASPSPADSRDSLVERLVKALEKIAEDTRRCDHDMGYDREMGPLGCSLGDRCVCLHIHMTAIAALAAKEQQP